MQFESMRPCYPAEQDPRGSERKRVAQSDPLAAVVALRGRAEMKEASRPGPSMAVVVPCT